MCKVVCDMGDLPPLLREASRELLRRPGLTTVGVLSLALASAANTTVFAIVNSLLLRPLAVTEPAELLSIYRRRGTEPWVSLSYGEYVDVTSSARAFAGVTAFTVPGLQASVRLTDGEASATPLALVSGSYFNVLGLRPLHGRFFGEAEDRRGAGTVPVVISEQLWRGRFGGVTDVVGSRARVNGHDGVIVGVMPASFVGTFTALRTDVWLPLAAQPLVLAGAESLDRRDSRFLNLIGRLQPGATTEQAEAELRGIAARLATAHPETDRNLGFTLTSTTGVPPFIGQFIGGFLAVLFGVVGMVLLVACSNLAGLLLARGAARSQELAVCTALGASRARLLTQLLLEALLVSILAAGLGLVLTRLALHSLLAVVPELGLPVQFDFGLDTRVFVFTLVALVVATALFGLVPALQATRAPLMPILRQGSAGAARRGRLRGVLLVLQIALSVVLLSSTALLVRGLRRAAHIDIGFNPERVALLHLEPTVLGYDSTRSAPLYAQLLARISAESGIESAALALYAPLGSRGDRLPVQLAGQRDTTPVGYNAVTSGFFDLLGIPFLQGRDFTTRDAGGSAGVAIVSATMARRHWPTQNPIGRHITIRGHDWEVVGVVRDIKHGTIGEVARPFLYLPLAQVQRARGAPVDAVLHVRATSDAAALLPALPRALAALDPDIPARATLMTQDMQISLFPAPGWTHRGRVWCACVAAGSGGTARLECVSGGPAHARVGIRVALGARATDVTRLVMAQSARATLIGLTLGVPLAMAAGTLLRALLYGVPATDPATHITVALALLAAVALAGWLPARRVNRSDPLSVMRTQV